MTGRLPGRLNGALRFTGMAALALALSACGDGNGKKDADVSSFALFDPMAPGGWPGDISGFSKSADFSENRYFSGAMPDLPSAVPMARSGASSARAFAPAPDYDYPADEPVYYDDAPSDRSYAWLALASALGGMLGDAPPDYAFDYDGVEPWAWQTGDDFVRYAEPLDDGYRYYYYSPGRSRPFLVSDPYYSYGYYNDRVAVIYDRDGRVLDQRRSWRQQQAAERYYTRAGDLYRVARYRPRQGVAAPLWAERRSQIAEAQRQWETARDKRRAWRDWDRRNDRQIARHWSGEREARQYAARRFDGWQRENYRSPAPRFYAEAGRNPRLQQAVARERLRTAPEAQRRAFTEQPQAAGARRGDIDGRSAFLQRQDIRRERAQPGFVQQQAFQRHQPGQRQVERRVQAQQMQQARLERTRERQQQAVDRRAASFDRQAMRGQQAQRPHVRAANSQSQAQRGMMAERSQLRQQARLQQQQARQSQQSDYRRQANVQQRAQVQMRQEQRQQARQDMRVQQQARQQQFRTQAQAQQQARQQQFRAQAQQPRFDRGQGAAQRMDRQRAQPQQQRMAERAQARQSFGGGERPQRGGGGNGNGGDRRMH